MLASILLSSFAHAEPLADDSDAGRTVASMRQQAALSDAIELLSSDGKPFLDDAGRPFLLVFNNPDNARMLADSDGGDGVFRKVAEVSPAVEEAKLVRIEVDLTTQKMTVYSPDGEFHFGVSSGKPGHATVQGHFDVDTDNEAGQPKDYRFYRNYTSHKYDAPMPYAIFFYNGFATHSAIGQWGCLGKTPCSHGCVRTAPETARKLYELTKKYGPQNVGFWIYDENAKKPKAPDPLTV